MGAPSGPLARTAVTQPQMHVTRLKILAFLLGRKNVDEIYNTNLVFGYKWLQIVPNTLFKKYRKTKTCFRVPILVFRRYLLNGKS